MAYSGGVGPQISPAVAPVAGTKILLKRSGVKGKLPSAGDAEYGELFINYHSGDPMLCFKDNADNIIEIKPARSVDGGGGEEPPDTGNTVGDLVWDGTHLRVWDGSTWLAVGPGSLAYVQAADKGTITNTAGDGCDIPLVNNLQAGLMSPGDKNKLDDYPATPDDLAATLDLQAVTDNGNTTTNGASFAGDITIKKTNPVINLQNDNGSNSYIVWNGNTSAGVDFANSDDSNAAIMRVAPDGVKVGTNVGNIATQNILLNASGSASFAGTIVAPGIRNSNGITANVGPGGYSASTDSSGNSRIWIYNNSADTTLANANFAVISSPDASTAKTYRHVVYKDGSVKIGSDINTSQTSISLNASDGSATFAGNVDVAVGKRFQSGEGTFNANANPGVFLGTQNEGTYSGSANLLLLSNYLSPDNNPNNYFVCFGSADGSSNAKVRRFLVKTDGELRISDDSSGAVANPKVTLSPDGSASFANFVSVGGSGSSVDGLVSHTSSQLPSQASCQVKNSGADASKALLFLGRGAGNTNQVEIWADGSARFAGSINSDSFIRSSRYKFSGTPIYSAFNVNLDSKDRAIAVWYDQANPLAAINTDGSASFTGDVTVGPDDAVKIGSAGRVDVSRADGISTAFSVTNKETDPDEETVTILANGSAIFKENTGNYNVQIRPFNSDNAAQILVEKDTDTRAAINGDGSANFSGNVSSEAYIYSTAGTNTDEFIQLGATPFGSEQACIAFSPNGGTSYNWYITPGGGASFAGGNAEINSAGQIISGDINSGNETLISDNVTSTANRIRMRTGGNNVFRVSGDGTTLIGDSAEITLNADGSGSFTGEVTADTFKYSGSAPSPALAGKEIDLVATLHLMAAKLAELGDVDVASLFVANDPAPVTQPADPADDEDASSAY